MYPGRLREQPMPLITIASWGRIPQLCERLLQRHQDAKVAAPGTPIRLALPLKSLRSTACAGSAPRARLWSRLALIHSSFAPLDFKFLVLDDVKVSFT